MTSHHSPTLPYLLLAVLVGCTPAPPTSPGNLSPNSATRAPQPTTAQASATKTESAVSPGDSTAAAEVGPSAPPAELFRFSETESGQLLAGMLIPERQPLPPLAIPTSPRSGRPMLLETLGLEAYRAPLPILPAPKGILPPAAPRPLDTPSESPPLAAVGLPELPAPVTLPATERLYAPSPEAPLPRPGVVAATVDPTAEAARAALLAAPVTGRATSAAPLPLEIADPFQVSREAALRQPPPEVPVAAGDGPRLKLPETPGK